ncbi:ATP-grasp domain-containing protein [Flavobacterium selenitireducens]|uniref:D-alanine--D-alanine ligase n=1 Tax=Flavobacterium selenitireducens TaxID=2722704 RepID=UPI00168AD40B|nr:D-alanine--D-alanine ligase [Flavobacterium selenitireducens]MBD3583674.1 D-alanine--D-alanine ligase [Flavobacterium selenitireducens]
MSLFLHKVFHWEYWPTYIVYVPVYFQWAWYALKSRTLFFFNASNPAIANGGFFMESKKQIYDLLPHIFPKTELLPPCASINVIRQKIVASGIHFPLIFKPDVGQRGTAVRRINTLEELLKYSGRSEFDFLIQDLIPYQNEVGIFYVRYPDQQMGRITGIVSKEFLIVTGDGVSSIETLMRKDPRHAMQIPKLRKQMGKRLGEVLLSGEKRNLVPYGNHVRGCKFTDASHLITPALTQTINEICLRIPGFYFGRLDIMFDNWPDFENAEKFQVVEINGASSEPTHIYDPKHSLFFGWKELMRHVRYMYEISAINHRNGVPYLSHKQGMRELRDYIDHNKKFDGF